MQITLNHLMVTVLPVFAMFTTFFIAEEWAKNNQNKQFYVWNPWNFYLRIIGIMVIGLAVAVLFGFLSYWAIFHPMYKYL